MATDATPDLERANGLDAGDDLGLRESIKKCLGPLASLRLTVVLLGLLIFLVFAGTMAQWKYGIGYVKHGYFWSWLAWIEWQVFFPPSFFPRADWPSLANVPESLPGPLSKIPASFPFPGGFAIGLAMFINLLAAHTMRFRVTAKSGRLAAGAAVLAAGVVVTWAVIASGSNKDPVQGSTEIEWDTLWSILKGALAVLFVVAVLGTVEAFRRAFGEETLPRWVAYLSAPVTILVGVLTAYLVIQRPDYQIADASMRILWQLIKGTMAGAVLLAGCVLLFKKRAGIVLLHAGIGLMMYNELHVAMTAVEGMMPIEEGQTVNYVLHTDEAELAVVDTSGKDKDKHTVVPAGLLEKGKVVEHAELPFDIRVEEYYANSNVRRVSAKDKNPATDGIGRIRIAEPAKTIAGTNTEGQVDLPSAYVTVFKKGSKTKLGTYLVTTHRGPSDVAVDNKTYQIDLRFKRTYKPYSFHLIDVRKNDYVGTDTPRDYSSFVSLVDPARKVKRDDIRIWMNNPLRYGGETFYQSNFRADTEPVIDPSTGRPVIDPATGRPKQRVVETTTLQVVTNPDWMIPYVACMIVVVGMLAHFGITLVRFVKRRARPAAEPQPVKSWAAVIVPGILAAGVLAWIAVRARPAEPAPSEMQIEEFAKIPVVFQGRPKPVDTLARNALTIISGRDYIKATDSEGNSYKIPAVKWFLDVAAGTPDADEHRIFRIEEHRVLELFGLKKRKGYRYAYKDFQDEFDEFVEQVNLAEEKPAEALEVYDRKLIELGRKFKQYQRLKNAFQEFPFAEFLKMDQQERGLSQTQAVSSTLRRVELLRDELKRMKAPLAVPELGEDAKKENDSDEDDWEYYSVAWFYVWIAQISDHTDQANPVALAWHNIYEAYRDKDEKAFNEAVAECRAAYEAESPEEVHLAKIDFEAYFNEFQPFSLASILYLGAFFVACIGLMGFQKTFNRSAFAIVVLTLLLHSFAIWGRMYISGRPPVTNLYSSAVFVGWVAVLGSVLIEMIYRLGLGNLFAGILGFGTLQIGSYLSGDGDTLSVLQAVLDTQFWLTTHVVAISVGYAATLLAGAIAIVYLLLEPLYFMVRAYATALLSQKSRDRFQPIANKWLPVIDRSLIRMCYGTVCFGIFFSFFGTVLGGLWADDSWGRFWGWDPKENGALIIVLWNAIVLHARWGKLVKDRGFATLAVAGNIVTAWSWFGVNELGVGLHSYGFTDGVLMALGIFVLSQMAVMGLAAIPRSSWLSKPPPGGENVA